MTRMALAGKIVLTLSRFSGLLAVLVVLCALGVGPIAATQKVQPPVRSPFQAQVINVHDGDTLSVRALDATVYRIRLEGIDAPEAGQPFSQVARNLTRELAFDKNVSVRIITTDRNRRLVSRVFVEGKDLSVALVRAGLAWHYTDFSHDPVLAGLQREARAGRRGLWSEQAPVAPWEWRSRGSRGVAPPVDRISLGEVRANVKSRVYHALTCRNSHCQNCTAVFETPAEAEGAGYRPAGDCFRGGK